MVNQNDFKNPKNWTNLVDAALAPFTPAHNADFTLERVCYICCRLLKPKIVVEAGVAYGVTTTFILQALHKNEGGELHSIDLPPLGKDAGAYVGYHLPKELCGLSTLHRGVSKRLLPKLLPSLRQVDIFVHDSLHTYSNIRRDLYLVTPYLARPAVFIAEDIEGNRAFEEWISQTLPSVWWAWKEESK